MQYRRRAAVLITALALAACGGGDAEPDTVGDSPAPAPAPAPAGGASAFADVELPVGVTPEMVAQGNQLFNSQVCFSCHGMDAAGGPLAPALTDQDWLNSDGSYENIMAVIRNGVAQPVQYPAPMPPMGGASLSDEQIQQLAAYVYAASRGS